MTKPIHPNSRANLKPRGPGPRRQRSGGVRLKVSKKNASDKRIMLDGGAVRDDKAVAEFFDAKAEIKKHTPAAIAKLVALLDSSDQRVAFAASREILDRNLGKPGIAEDQRGLGTITIKWSGGEGPSRYGDSIDGQLKNVTPEKDWSATMAKAIERAAHAPADDEDEEDLTQTMEN